MKTSIILIILILIGVSIVVLIKQQPKPKIQNSTNTNTMQTPQTKVEVYAPISNADARITKKYVGLYVSPGHSPVSPEKFTGYHTGTDFEIFPGEENTDVAISAVCTGKILRKGTATGYGGIVVTACNINNEDVTVVYGHLRISSVTQNVGDTLLQGNQFGVLGTGYSSETSGERKHLHLGIHKGTAMDIKGYVSDESELSNWLDYRNLMNVSN